ncbi:hypothetical protein JZO78_08185 [Enterococcus ureilyticus]|uniref:hypothetical protein n=1 Tax=Enterococcus ureilyticus TaxID=1131292 RepID=UPI001A92EB3F|nr:hypothetical protein [Enterococcus ureilyticus]MBO0446321.1 hypothetical protein [Enterococcus ureilyticus]
MNFSKKVKVAKELIEYLLTDSEEVSWVNFSKSKYKNEIINVSESSSGIYGNTFICITAKSKILAIGKYEERYYTDENEYYSLYPYFFSYGNISGDKITSIETVIESEFGDTDKLAELYSKVNISNMNINLDDITNSFF